MQSFERPLSRHLRGVDEWLLVAGKRLIALPIPDTQHENPSGVSKSRLLTRCGPSRPAALGKPIAERRFRSPLFGQVHLAEERLVARVTL
jgi:hypothetical protein